MRFETRRLEDVLSTLIDYRGKTPTKTDSGVRLITAKVIKDGFINDSSFEYISADEYDSWMRRGLPKQWDILITTEAPMGEVAQLRTPERVALAQRVILLRADPKIMSQNYLFHALKSPFVQAELKKRATGTTVLGIKQSELRLVEIPFLPIHLQQRIANILSSYDDLIENNTRRINMLEEVARSLYREWFLHFRFPGRKGGSPGGAPKSWATVSLSEVVTVNEHSIRRDEEPEVVDYVDISSVSPGHIHIVQRLPFAEAPGRARRLVQHGDTIWSMVRPNRRSYAMIMNPPATMVVSTGFAVLTPRTVPASFLYLATTTDEFVDYISKRAKGSAYPAVTASDFEDARLLVAEDALMRRFHEYVMPMLEQAHSLRHRNKVLQKARDLLLPRLLSSELDVSSLALDPAA